MFCKMGEVELRGEFPNPHVSLLVSCTRIHLSGPAVKPMDHAWMKSLVSVISLNLFRMELPSSIPEMGESLQD